MLQPSKTIPASQVKNNFGAIVSRVQSGDYSEVIVENHGEPVAAIVSMDDLKSVREFKEQEKQRKALELLREVRREVQTRMRGKLTDREAMKIADRFSHELVEDLAKKGKVTFERKSHK